MNAPAVPPIAELTAPAAWRAVDLISDLHLDAAEPATFDAWRAFMLAPGGADAVLILGDLFEVWVGDDAATPGSFEAACGDVLRAASARRPVAFMAGNRDFLVRSGFLDACGVQPLADPTLLILDEATSSVDTTTEKEIQKALDNLVRGRTTIAIAHRLSTLRDANRLVVLDRGKVVEIGGHDELMAQEGHYYRLYQAQARNAENEEAARSEREDESNERGVRDEE